MLSSRSAHQSSDIADPAATGLLKAEMINAPGSIDRPCKAGRVVGNERASSAARLNFLSSALLDFHDVLISRAVV
jgi:hypothetical protein